MGFDIGGLLGGVSSIFKGVGSASGNSGLAEAGEILSKTARIAGDSRVASEGGQSSGMNLGSVGGLMSSFIGGLGGSAKGDGGGKGGVFGALGGAIGGLFGQQQLGSTVGGLLGSLF